MINNPIFGIRNQLKQSNLIFLIILVLNLTLAMFSLFYLYQINEQIYFKREILLYSSFLDLYYRTSLIEFALLIYAVPFLLIRNMNREWEGRTGDYWLWMPLSLWKVLWSKIYLLLYVMGLCFISASPILFMVFIYGGIRLSDVLSQFILLMVSGFFVGSMTLYCTIVWRKMNLALFFSYFFLFLSTIGTYLVNWLLVYSQELRYRYDDVEVVHFAGKSLYLLLFNPLFFFYQFLLRKVKGENSLLSLFRYFNTEIYDFKEYSSWTVISIIVQIVIGFFFLFLSRYRLSLFKLEKEETK